MIGGVNFQPGMMGPNGSQPRPKSGNSVQEAIKILSLRLPKQVGPNALAPAALLNAQGSNGNPRVDSVVSQVMGRMFPQGQPESPAAGASGAPVLGPSAGENSTMPVSSPIRFDGSTRPPDNTPLSSMMPTDPVPVARAPRITPAKQGPLPVPEPPSPLPPQEMEAMAPTATAEPTQDPWADLMAMLRRKNETPQMQDDTPIR